MNIVTDVLRAVIAALGSAEVEAAMRQRRIDATARAVLLGLVAELPPVSDPFAGLAKEAYDYAEAMEAERTRRLSKEP